MTELEFQLAKDVEGHKTANLQVNIRKAKLAYTSYARRLRRKAIREMRRDFYTRKQRDNIDRQIQVHPSERVTAVKESCLSASRTAIKQCLYEGTTEDEPDRLMRTIHAMANLCSEGKLFKIPRRGLTDPERFKEKQILMQQAQCRFSQSHAAPYSTPRKCKWGNCAAYLHFSRDAHSQRPSNSPKLWTVQQCVVHLWRHARQTTQCQWSVCKQSLSSQQHLFDHLHDKHNVPTELAPYQGEICGLCPTPSFTQAEWNDHCQLHQAAIPEQIGPWVRISQGFQTVIPGLCPFCLIAEEKSGIKYWWLLKSYQIHICDHLRRTSAENNACPHPFCDANPGSLENLIGHLTDHNVWLTQTQRSSVFGHTRPMVEAARAITGTD